MTSFEFKAKKYEHTYSFDRAGCCRNCPLPGEFFYPDGGQHQADIEYRRGSCGGDLVDEGGWSFRVFGECSGLEL